jgi:hypothetical protein
VSIADAAETNGLFDIQVSDLRPAARVRQIAAPRPGQRLSTHLRGRRFLASLLAMLLVALDLAPGAPIGPAAALLSAPAKTWRAGQRLPLTRPPAAPDAAQPADEYAPANLNSVWPSLWQRPLHLPTVAIGQPCPATPGRTFTEGRGPGLGDGPVYLLLPGPNDATLHAEPLRGLVGSSRGWSGLQVLWVIHPLYQGPVLVRGGRIDSAGALDFNGGLDQSLEPNQLAAEPPLTHLRLVGDSSYGAPWVEWMTYLRVREAGCYAVQADGLSFSETIVFRATVAKSLSPGER